tara:strand:- start:13 stop:666 length:654 start_codon:yes stop_codon:yes gene_type:complete
MPKAPGTLVEPSITQWGPGKSDTKLVAASFPAGPIGGEPKDTPIGELPQPLTDAWIKVDFRSKVMRGTPGGDATAYYNFDFFTRNYGIIQGGPALFNQYLWTGKLPSGVPEPGQPTNSFIPNPTSVENADPLNAYAPPGEKLLKWANSDSRLGAAPFIGPGTGLSPQVAAVRLAHVAPGWSVSTPAGPAVTNSNVGGIAATLGIYDLGKANAGGEGL